MPTNMPGGLDSFPRPVSGVDYLDTAGKLLTVMIDDAFSAVEALEDLNLGARINVKGRQWAGGAKGDGATDDSAAIQAAINASAVGDTIYFPTGTYLIGTHILLKPWRRYTGSFGWTTTIKQKTGSNMPDALFVSEDWYNNNTAVGQPLMIEHLAFDGNSTNNTGTAHAILLMNWASKIHHCWASNMDGCGAYITVVNRSGATISNNLTETSIFDFRTSPPIGDACIRVNAPAGNKATDGQIKGCLSLYGGDYGIKVDSGAGWSIDNNHTYSQQLNGIEVIFCHATSVTNNQVESYGVQGSGAGYYTGINVSMIAGAPTTIANNRIWDPGSVTTGNFTGYGVHAQASNAANALLSGNTYWGGSRTGEQGLLLDVQSGGTIAVSLGRNATWGTTSANRLVVGSGITFIADLVGPMDMRQVTAPAAPSAATGRYFTRDNGAGKTQAAAIFPTGAIQVEATEP